MKQAEEGICFIFLDGKEKFRVQDGDMVRIITGAESHLDRMARYVDDKLHDHKLARRPRKLIA